MTNDIKNDIDNKTEKCLICGRGRAYFEALGAGEISEERMMQLREKAREHARRHEELKKMTIEERLMFLLVARLKVTPFAKEDSPLTIQTQFS